MKLSFMDFKANYPDTLTLTELAAFWKWERIRLRLYLPTEGPLLVRLLRRRSATVRPE